MTLSDLQIRLPTASSCAAIDKISSSLTQRIARSLCGSRTSYSCFGGISFVILNTRFLLPLLDTHILGN